MKIHNRLPLLIECLRRWESCPTEEQFVVEYATPMQSSAGDFFEDFHGVLTDLDWNAYRRQTLKIDAAQEEARLKSHIKAVEDLFGFLLQGDVNLMGSFGAMDGYARFDRGSHMVFLGVDESFHRDRYIDILTTHELTHVARESRPEVWQGFGLNPRMTQAEFTESQPVIEHLMGEGFSCAVSEILVPHQPAWEYAYQTQKSLAKVLGNGPSLDQTVHFELRHPDGDYGRLYRARPAFAHYVWAWQWTKHVLKKYADGDPRKLVARCSKDFIQDALEFKLPTSVL